MTAKAPHAKRKEKSRCRKDRTTGATSPLQGFLERQEYTGCTCNFKTYSKSYKLKKRIPNEPENMFYLPDTQEAIVSQAQFDRVQELRKTNAAPAKSGTAGIVLRASVLCRLRRQAPLCHKQKALRASRITTSATTTRATVVLVLPTISGKMCFVKSFWNASGQSMSISEAMWTVFRRNGCNAAGLTRSAASGMTKRSWNRQRNALPI